MNSWVGIELEPGTYGIEIGDLVGDKWGESFNYVIENGKTTVVSLTLAQMAIGLRDADGKPLQGRWAGVSLQKQDISGNPVRGDRIAEARTDNTGVVVYNLVPATYTVDIADIFGEAWGNPFDHVLPAGQTVKLIVTLGRLSVGVTDVDGKPISGRWVGAWFQKKDVSGNPVIGDRFLEGRTDGTGAIRWDVTAGTYAVDIGDISGNQWGDPMNHAVTSGQTTSIVLRLGRLLVGLKDGTNKPLEGKWVGVYFQKKDVSGNVVKGDRFLEGRTDNTGIVWWNITAGNYLMEIEGVSKILEVEVQSGKTTSTDGVSVTVK